MKRFDVSCPVCGKVNHGLFLEETNGCFECDSCGIITILPMTAGSKSFRCESGPYETDLIMQTIPA